jgi:hypothetical protein
MDPPQDTSAALAVAVTHRMIPLMRDDRNFHVRVSYQSVTKIRWC